MDLNYTPAERAFRDEVRAWMEANVPADLAEKVRLHKTLTREEMARWHALLNSRGWLAGHWPKHYGGQGWTAVERHIFDVERARAHGPAIVPFGVNMLGPVLMEYGTEAQKAYYLPRILNGEDWWCQGYSEPGSGSDLASLRTRAERKGDRYIVNGQKTWTTLGQYANKIFCLVRTDPKAKPQAGISFLLIDMNSPGVEVRPIILIDGVHEVNEVWFTDVEVPVENLVGKENEGWTVAKYLLTHERTAIAGVGEAEAALSSLKRIARAEQHKGRPLIENPHFAARLARIEIDLMALAMTNLRLLAAADKGAPPGPEAGMLKIKGTVIRQAINDLTRRAVGPWALPFVSEALETNTPHPGPDYAHRAAGHYLNNRKLSIYGGSNEIQRNIIAKALGL